MWQDLVVDLTGMAAAEEVRDRLLDSITGLDAELSAGRWCPEAVGLQIRLSGRSRFGSEAVRLLEQDRQMIVYHGRDGTAYFIERLKAVVQPEIGLEALAPVSYTHLTLPTICSV